MKNITLLGTGAMGQRMAMKLLEADFSVTLYNRNPQRYQSLLKAGAIAADTPSNAVKNADVIITMLRDDEAINAVMLSATSGALKQVKPGCIVLQTSTLSMICTKTLAEKVSAHGAKFIDAPVVGSRPQAESGQLLFLLAGEQAIIDVIEPVVSSMGKIINTDGVSGTATALKHAANAYFGIQVAALAELVGMLTKLDIPLSRATDIMSCLPITSPALQFLLKQMAQQSYPALFPIELVGKDFAYMAATAKMCAADTSITAQAGHLFQDAEKQGYGDENISAVAKLFLPRS